MVSTQSNLASTTTRLQGLTGTTPVTWMLLRSGVLLLHWDGAVNGTNGKPIKTISRVKSGGGEFGLNHTCNIRWPAPPFCAEDLHNGPSPERVFNGKNAWNSDLGVEKAYQIQGTFTRRYRYHRGVSNGIFCGIVSGPRALIKSTIFSARRSDVQVEASCWKRH